VLCSALHCALQRSAVWWRCSAVQRSAEQHSAVQLWCAQWRALKQYFPVLFLGLPCSRGTLYQYCTAVQLSASHYSAQLTTFAPTGRDCGEAAATARTSASEYRYMADHLHSPVPTLYLYWQRPSHSALLFTLHCTLHCTLTTELRPTLHTALHTALHPTLTTALHTALHTGLRTALHCTTHCSAHCTAH
jgi:hypothetical protein